MKQIILTWDEFNDIWDQRTERLLLRLLVINKSEIECGLRNDI